MTSVEYGGRSPLLRSRRQAGAVHLNRNGREVDQFAHRRQFGDEAAHLALALVLHEQVGEGLQCQNAEGLMRGAIVPRSRRQG